MMTTNLQEMIQPNPNVSEASLPEIMDSNYQPETEQALIDYVVSQNNRLEIANIFVKWEIGRSINSFYEGKYGARELEKISKETGIGRDNLNKMIKFAEQYTQEQLKALIKGSFAISWNGIAQNLSIKPEKLIEVYEKAGTIREFHKGIMNCKDPDEKRGKSKSVEKPEQSNIAPTEIRVAVIPAKIIPDEPAIVEYDEPADDIDPDELAKQYESYAKELETLRTENQLLKTEIAGINEQVNSLHTMMKEDAAYIDENDRIIEAYRDRFKRLRFMVENSFSVGDIMELLVAVE
jgi:hypothetical protein